MTTEEKNRIAALRRAGIGYARIAQELGISKNTVKTYCRRNGMAGVAEESVAELPVLEAAHKPCRLCGRMFIQYPGHREKKFCSDICRVKWWNGHADEMSHASMIEHTCLHCGKVFKAYGNRNRKYCSHACYIAERFGGAPCE